MKIFTFLGALSWLLLSLLPGQLWAQNYLLPVSDNVSYTTCTGTLYDSGGPAGNYATGYHDGVVTLTPSTAGSKLQLAFTLLEVGAPGAFVSVYDGPTTASLLIGSFTSGTPTVHATNTKGELTVRFYSNGSAPPRAGFAATISCETNVLLPDLTARGAKVSPARVLPTQGCTATVQVANLSGVPTLSYAAFYFSTDSLYSTDDRYITSSVGERLEVGKSITYVPRVEIPAGTAPGRYYVLCLADPYQAISESNETNNLAYAAVEVLPPAPDLAPETFGPKVVAASLVPGQSQLVGYSIRNQGVLPAEPTAVGYYLSADSLLSADDEFLDESPLETLAPNTPLNLSMRVSIAPGKPYGRYYLLFVADYLQQIVESNEANNIAVAALDVVPPTIDLRILYTPIMYPNEVGAGGKVSTICYVQNWSNVTANPCTVGYYLSKDKELSSDDVLVGDTLVLGSVTRGILLAGDDSRANGRAVIPLNTPPGHYYLLLVADHLNQLAESDETNNVSSASLDVVIPDIDLAISMPAVPATQAPIGNPLGVNCYLINNGTTAVSPCTVGYYLSKDKELSFDDQLLSNTSITVLPKQGGNYAGSSPVIPSGTAPGSYYLLLMADYLNQVAETDETNNLSYVAIEVVKPTYDLTFQYQPSAGPSPTPAGSTLTATCHLQNLGPTTAYGSSVGYYLSTDKVLDNSDILVGANKSWAVYGNYFDYLTSSVVLPMTTPPGTYYLLFVADYQQLLPETNEDNNLAYVTIQVTTAYPDLAIPAKPTASPARVLAGATFSTNCTLQNLGNNLAAPVTVGYYLSTNSVLDAKDVLIGQTTTPEVYPGTSVYLPGTAAIPAATVSGAYYILFVADHLNQLAETDETNNSNYLALRVLVTGVDLSMQLPTVAPATVVAGATVAVGATLYNGGSAVAGSSPAGFYLSPDPSFDASDVLLSAAPGGALASATGSPRTATLTIPLGTPVGSYYLLAVADPLNEVAEANERNNVAFLPLTVTSPFTAIVMPASGASTFVTCAGRVYDSGGTGNYLNNTNSTLTIVPDIAGAVTTLTFSLFATENKADYLEIYDGTSTSAPLLGSFTGTSPPSTLRASTTSPTGALTLHFVSNGSVNAAGFEATISCAQRLATREQLAGYELRVLPVPVASPVPLRVQLSGLGQRTTATLALYNNLGQVVGTQSLILTPGHLNQAELPTAGLAAGVYVLRLSGEDLHAVRRVVVE